jgi:DNA polymerase (family 10)
MADVYDVLARIGFGYGLLGEHPMRARAYTNGARIVKKLGKGVRAAYYDGELGKIRGIGKGLLTTIGAVLEGRPVPPLQELEERIPAGLFSARRIRGIGPSKIRALWQELGLTTLAEIEYACNENRLIDLKGFGPKTQAAVLLSLETMREGRDALRQDQAMDGARSALARLEAEGIRAELVGDVRRGTEISMSVDLLILGSESDLDRATKLLAGEGTVPITVTTCSDASLFAVHTLLATGTSEHIAALAARAEAEGGSLDAEGLFLDRGMGPEQIVCDTEDAIYAALGLHPTAPERREPEVPLVGVGKARPRLVRREDLRGALHNHTIDSDWIHTLEEMRAAAAAMGLEYLGISEHSRTAAYAGGLPIDRLLAQIAAVEALNAEPGAPAVLLTGIESDILRDGGLDYPDEILAALQVVVASVHTRYSADPEAMTARMCAVARNPYTAIVGHPTGRLLLGRAPSAFDVSAFLDACAEGGCAVELNANPQRLDLNEVHCAMAKERGVLVSISADAHSAQALVHLEHGVSIARRAGLTPDDVLNAFTLDRLETWLETRGVASV